MLIDYPDYTKTNLWQIRTIQSRAPEEVRHTNSLKLFSCRFLHISWEDYMIRGCTSEAEAEKVVSVFSRYLDVQCKTAKLIWTLHNLTSFTCAFKAAEARLRGVIMQHADLILLMSDKHRFMIPPACQEKVRILPHYILPTPYPGLPREKKPCLFRYGMPRAETGLEDYLQLLRDDGVRKLVSDPRVTAELDDGQNVIVRRRFSAVEADLYGRLANFAYFYRGAQLNSGVLNFALGNKLILFHNREAFQYFDVPAFYQAFCAEKFDPEHMDFAACQQVMADHDAELEAYIAARAPEKISAKFWQYLNEL